MPGEAFCELQWISDWVLALTTISFKSVSAAVFLISASRQVPLCLPEDFKTHLESSRESSICRSYGWNQQFKKSIILFIPEQTNKQNLFLVSTSQTSEAVNVASILCKIIKIDFIMAFKTRAFWFLTPQLLLLECDVWLFCLLISGRCMALQWVMFVWIKPSLISSSHVFTFRLQMAVLNRWDKCGH